MPSPRRRRRLVLLCVAVVVLAWLGVAALQLVQARAAAERGAELAGDTGLLDGDITAVVAADGPDEDPVDRIAEARRSLQRSSEEFSDATSSLDGAVLAPVRVLPFVGRQLRAVIDVTGAATDVTGSAADALAELEELAGREVAEPGERIDAVVETSGVLQGLLAEIEDVDLGPGTALVGPVRRLRDRAEEQLASAEGGVASAVVGLDGARSFLAGPSDYLVLVANNAEMRAGSGMFLQAGTMTVDGGRFELSELTPTGDMYLELPGATMDADMTARWGALQPNQEWRNLNLSPRFAESARMATEMWAAGGRGAVQGAMAVDIVSVQRLLELTGPVDVTGPDGVVTYDSENVLGLLAREQYLSDTAAEDRREQLGAVATAVFDAFNERPVPATGLVSMLLGAGAQRHLLLWSADPVQQAAWEELGVAGELTPDSLLLALINRGGTKLDPYVAVETSMAASDVDGGRRVTLTTSVRNDAPDWLPTYVQGPVEGSGGAAGEYVGILAFSVPAAASEPEVSTDGFAVAGADGPTQVIGVNLAVPRGEQREVTVSFTLPADSTEVEVVPSGREPPVLWRAGEMMWSEHGIVTVPLDVLVTQG